MQRGLGGHSLKNAILSHTPNYCRTQTTIRGGLGSLRWEMGALSGKDLMKNHMRPRAGAWRNMMYWRMV